MTLLTNTFLQSLTVRVARITIQIGKEFMERSLEIRMEQTQSLLYGIHGYNNFSLSVILNSFLTKYLIIRCLKFLIMYRSLLVTVKISWMIRILHLRIAFEKFFYFFCKIFTNLRLLFFMVCNNKLDLSDTFGYHLILWEEYSGNVPFELEWNLNKLQHKWKYSIFQKYTVKHLFLMPQMRAIYSLHLGIYSYQHFDKRIWKKSINWYRKNSTIQGARVAHW